MTTNTVLLSLRDKGVKIDFLLGIVPPLSG